MGRNRSRENQRGKGIKIRASRVSTVGRSVCLPGHALRLVSAVCPVSLRNSFLALSWGRAVCPVCTCVCGGAVSAAAGVRARGGGLLCPWGSD